MSDLYDTDVLEWSAHQAQLLRQYAAGKPGNEAPDWANIIDEVESVGRSQLNAVRSLLVHALIHDIECEAWPGTTYVPHWQAEARIARGNAADAFAPSMRRQIDIEGLYRRALRGMPASIDGQPPLPVPDVCPFTLDELLETLQP